MMWDASGWCGGGWGAGGWLMLTGIVLLVVATTLLVVYALRGASRGGLANAGPAQSPADVPRAASAASPTLRETAREIVERRYAAGEIDREEFLQKLQDL